MMKAKRFVYILACLILLQGMLFAQTVYSWQGPNLTGNWDSPSNWSPAGVPGPGDGVTDITVSDTVLTNGAREVATLHNHGVVILSGSDGALTITGNAFWPGGRFVDRTNNNDGVLTIAAGATLETSNGMVSGKILEEGVTLHNQGTILAHHGFAAIENSTVINEGVFEIDGNHFFGTTGGNTGFIINSGVIRKISGTSNAQFGSEWELLNQGGEFDVQSGNLYFYGDATLVDGTYNAAAGATLFFTSGDHVFEGTLTGAPTGDVKFNTATTQVNASGATLDFQGTGFQWNGTDFTGGGTLTIPAGALMVVIPGSANLIEGATTLLNEGTIRAQANFAAIEGSVVDNHGLVEIVGTHNFGNADGTFLNSGTVRQSSGSNITSFTAGWDWINQGGDIDIQAGTLRIWAGTFVDGNYNAEAGATLSINPNDTIYFEGTLSGSPAGRVELGGGHFHVGPSGVILDFQSAGVHWNGADFTGGGTVTIPDSALMTITSGGILQDNSSLLNLGTIQVESNFAVQDGGFVDNRGLINLVSDGNFLNTTGMFLNSGIFRKSGGSGTTNFSAGWDWQNLGGGIIEIDSGRLNFNSLNNAQNAIIMGNATVRVPGSFINDGIIRPGNPSGVLNYEFDFTPSPTGVLDIQLGGLIPGSEYDQLAVNRTVSLNGTLNLSLINGFLPTAGDSFVVLTTTTGTVNDSFLTVNVPSGLFVDVILNSNNVTIVIDSVGMVSIDEPEPVAEVITSYQLQQNYPNPFNPSTTIRYQLPVSGAVQIIVYDMLGRHVRTLTDERQTAGSHQVLWDGKNERGVTVASGVYFYRMMTANYVDTRKMFLLR